MDISYEELMKLDNEEIFQKLSSFFDNIFKFNNTEGLSYIDFKNIILEEIELSKQEYTGSSDYVSFIKRNVIRRMKSDSENLETSVLSNYIRDISNVKMYDKSIEEELINKAQNGDIEARNMIVENYLKLVISIAKRYLDKGLSFEDLIQEGNFGIIKAIKKYDKTKGTKFSTYSVWWIRQSITRAIADKGKTIRIPVHLYEKVALYKKVCAQLEKKLERYPTDEEIMEMMNINQETLSFINKIINDTYSLNEKLFEEQNVELEEIIPNEDVPVDTQVIRNNMNEDVRDLVESVGLSEREINLLRLRNGFGGKEPITLEEIGASYGLTRERIRQIENAVLNKLIGYNNIYDYIGYMDSPEKAFKKINKMNTYLNNKKREKKYHINEEIRYNPETEKVERRKVKTLYEIFHNYSDIKIKIAFSKLNILDQLFVFFRYGGNLEEPYIFEITDKQKEYFNEVIIPKMNDIISKIKYEEVLKYAQGKALAYNSFNSFDLIKFKKLMDKYINSGISCYLTINQFFIKMFQEGYINNKKYTKKEIQTILHLDDDDYQTCINEEKEICEDKEDDISIKKILKRI